MKITAAIITFNEESNIPALIANLKELVDEILIVDSFSTDKTAETARTLGARVILNKWTDYAKQKQFALEKSSNDYILTLDADERVSPELIKSILITKTTADLADGYLISRKAFYLGKWIKHSGWYPNRKIRLFNKSCAKWEGDFVHEHLFFQGSSKTLAGDILHYPYPDISKHIEKTNTYACLSARKLHESGRKFSILKLLLSPLFRIIRHFFLKAGFLDGIQGLVISILSAYYVFLKFLYLRELQSNEDSSC
jgi:glycosyltransferase involved in cell wall biosynthesis